MRPSCSQNEHSDTATLRKCGGFTILELLVVVSLIGMLSSVILASVASSRAKTRDARRIADIRQIQTALELYYESHDLHQYPTTIQGLAILKTSGFMSEVPKDPLNGLDYTYIGLNTSNASCSALPCVSYHLGVSLADKNNPALLTDADDNSSFSFKGTSASREGVICHPNTAGTPQPNGTETCYDVKP